MRPSRYRTLLVASASGTLLRLSRELTDRGWTVRRLETVRTTPVRFARLPRWLVRGPRPDVWVVTSRAVVETFARGHEGRLRALRRIPCVVAIGPGTASALRSVGLRPRSGAPAGGTAALLSALGAVDGLRVLYLRSDRAGPVLARRLRRRGATVIERVVYRTRPASRLSRTTRERLAGVRVWAVSSPSAVAGLRRALGEPLFRRERERVRAVAIGPRTGRALRAAGVREVHVSAESSEEGLTKLLGHVLGDGL